MVHKLTPTLNDNLVIEAKDVMAAMLWPSCPHQEGTRSDGSMWWKRGTTVRDNTRLHAEGGLACRCLIMCVPAELSSMSLHVWSRVFHWQPQELATHDMHLGTRGGTGTDQHQRQRSTVIPATLLAGSTHTHKSTHKQNVKTCKLIKGRPAQKIHGADNEMDLCNFT